ncbi:cytochrome bd-I ubiquinol oxidase subunit 2 apoprotein [Halopolyspora algeriensis]|uniref:Cytochrome bd-I ubiquinol oxidase subunit 2 apoprotein n=1 Tax=Halopolyspora algeriensis TaxID=1500506 RepID=A0A368VW16_9ACTN|nr:cytochrome d ubiquinol oxidase subunit II [Halopolyspora algeriensis]RCW46304.1 cytochrome bd-I ubiquinol oxidase subunit 2 apoprotein [Halopolyspora algeriensis]TQM55704.1 cytochrome bd-I ubiquinol oxidase subunit 2 apoprotein [Halopolyspora algeriensis]
MSLLPETTVAVLWVGLTAYVLFGGADFGGGVWDLLAGGTERGRGQRTLVEHSIGPVWEANHVWLIFVVVMMWTGIPAVFAAIASTLYIPLTLVALGIIARGAAFAFRKASTELWQQRLFGATFAFSSLVTPYFLGAVAGGIASGRVPAGIAEGDLVSSWVNPTSAATGALAVGVAAYLAAVYLTRDAQRQGDHALAETFRRRALITGVIVGALSLAGIFVLRADAPDLYVALTSGRALPLLVVSIVSGVASLLLLWWRAYLAVRLTAALAVTGLLWGWGVGQYPYLLPGVTLEEAAATEAVLGATLVSLAVGAVLLIPSLWWLYATFQRGHHEEFGTEERGSRAG